MFDATRSFENYSFKNEKTQIALDENNENISGMGFCEGTLKYGMILQKDKRKLIEGPFTIYFSQIWDIWKICFFFIPGFNLHKKE